MATKVLTQNAAELLLSGQTTLECTACGTSNWTKVPPALQTKKPGLLTVRCKTCANAKNLAYKKERYATDEEWREAKKASDLAYSKERYANDEAWREAKKASSLACSKERYATDPVYREAMLARNKERYANDEEWREAKKASDLQWQKDNPGKVNAKNAKRRSKKLQATPPWADLSAIQAFYEACPEGHHVDHVVPLQGREVCGLHVLDNLQYLTATENCSKGNKFNEQ